MKRKKWKENKNLFVNNNVKLNKDKLKNNNKHQKRVNNSMYKYNKHNNHKLILVNGIITKQI